MINEGSCPKYYFQMMNNCSIWRIEHLLIIFSLEKMAKRDFRDCMKHTTGSAESYRVGDANVRIRAGPDAVLQVLK